MPNVFLDEVIPRLPPGAVRVILAIIRFTYGFGKASDRISLTQLQRATGLSREGVVQGVKGLRNLITVKPGAKGRGANEYTLNLDISTGRLVNISDQSENLTSQLRPQKVVRKVDSPKPIISKPIERVRDKPSPSNGSDSRIKEFFDWWHVEFQSRFKEPYSFNGGKDGANIKRLLQSYDLPRLKSLATLFLDSKDPWVQQNGGFTIGVFASQINKLVSTTKASHPWPQPKELPL